MPVLASRTEADCKRLNMADETAERDLKNEILFYAVKQWNLQFSGSTSLEIARYLDIPHLEAMNLIVELEEEGKASVGRDKNIYVISLDTETFKQTIDEEPTGCHFIFPSKEVLTEFFYKSELVRMNIPIYRARQHQGSASYDYAFFKEEVLAKYLSRPELYEVEDSLSGGSIKAQVTCDSFVYLRYGKRMMSNGSRVVIALYNDLVGMEEDEQRYWNGFEINEPEFASQDENYDRFVDHTFEGAWIDYHAPITNVLQAIVCANEKIGGKGLFRHTVNPHLRAPVENTYKAFLDCCSELFKVMGTDSLNADTLKVVLEKTFSLSADSFVHKESGRALSAFQLLQLVEDSAAMERKASGIIDRVKVHRIRADHAILAPAVASENYIDQFNRLCDDVSYALLYFATKIETVIYEQQ